MKTHMLPYTLLVMVIGAGVASLLNGAVAAACDEAACGPVEIDAYETDEPITLRCPRASDPATLIAVEVLP